MNMRSIDSIAASTISNLEIEKRDLIAMLERAVRAHESSDAGLYDPAFSHEARALINRSKGDAA